MRWVAWMLVGPALWAGLFSAVYALHGLGCAMGWPGVSTPLGTRHVVTMAAVWLAGLALHVAILRAAPRGQTLAGRLPRIGAWIGLISSLFTLWPVLLLSTCPPPA